MSNDNPWWHSSGDDRIDGRRSGDFLNCCWCLARCRRYTSALAALELLIPAVANADSGAALSLMDSLHAVMFPRSSLRSRATRVTALKMCALAGRSTEEIDDVEKRRLALGMLSDVVRGPAGAAA